MKTCYVFKHFRNKSLALIQQANKIIEEYSKEGYLLTLRQLYYQFVSRDLIPNTIRAYSMLGSVINDARLAGLIDWDAIEDRTRNLHRLSTWSHPSDILQASSEQYRRDLWEDQDHHLEIWIEKEALAGVFQRVCDLHRVSFFSCRGYVSQSEMYVASQRLLHYINAGKEPVILHFGDHDPSGIDMTRDISDRLGIFLGKNKSHFKLRRMALNMDQIAKYRPPPNPAKETDSRFQDYKWNFGDQSWELDALDPKVLSKIVEKEVLQYRDDDSYAEAQAEELRQKKQLQKISENYDKIVRRFK